MTPRLLSGTFRDFQLLKLNLDKLLSNFAFNCNLRHYNMEAERLLLRNRVMPMLTERWGGAG